MGVRFSHGGAHRIAARCGEVVVAEFLEGATPEVLVRDRPGAQMNHAKAHQVCLAPLLRDAAWLAAQSSPHDEPG